MCESLPSLLYDFVRSGIPERFATSSHLFLKLKRSTRTVLYDITDDVPGRLEGVVETLGLASAIRHSFPKSCLQLCLPSCANVLFNDVPHRRDQNDTRHRVRAAYTLEHAYIAQRSPAYAIVRDAVQIDDSRQLGFPFMTNAELVTMESIRGSSLTLQLAIRRLYPRSRFLTCRYRQTRACRRRPQDEGPWGW
jgi:hypothetical protein